MVKSTKILSSIILSLVVVMSVFGTFSPVNAASSAREVRLSNDWWRATEARAWVSGNTNFSGGYIQFLSSANSSKCEWWGTCYINSKGIVSSIKNSWRIARSCNGLESYVNNGQWTNYYNNWAQSGNKTIFTTGGSCSFLAKLDSTSTVVYNGNTTLVATTAIQGIY
jgi:hypothetical protein